MKKTVLQRFSLLFAFIFLTVFMVSCSKKPQQTFAEAHDAFQTKLVTQDNDSDKVPTPPKGVFDLVKYPSKVGDLAAYVSSDPSHGQKAPPHHLGGWRLGKRHRRVPLVLR